MTDTAASARFAADEFRIGRILNRTTSVLSQNFLPFFVVTAIAQLPTVLLSQGLSVPAGPALSPEALLGGIIGILLLMIVLSVLSQAIVLYGAFQDMRGRPVSLTESLQVGLRRFFAIIGLGIFMAIFVWLGLLLLVVPGVIMFTMWFVATPACIVEQLGPFRSMRRSRELTKGHRWKIFGLFLLLIFISGFVSGVLGSSLGALGGTALSLIGTIVWGGAWGAFYAIAAVVTYHDLRIAKEGIDTEQIAAVFD